MKTIRLVNESGKHVADAEVPDEFVGRPGSYIFNGTHIWEILREDVYTDADPHGPKIEYVVSE